MTLWRTPSDIYVIDHTFYGFTRVITHAGCWENTIIGSIILLLDCPATCTCLVSFSRFSWVTISVVQRKLCIRFGSDFEIRTHCTSARGAGTPLYKLYRYVPPYRVGFLRRFGLKTTIHFAHFGLESGMNVLSFYFQMSKKEREICEFEIHLKNFLFAL